MPISLDSLIAALRAALPVAEQLAKITSSQWDDQAVAFLKALLANDALLDFVRQILGDARVVTLTGSERTLAIRNAADMHVNATAQQAAEAAGFNWTTVLQYLPLVVRLILTALGKRG